MHWRLRGVDAGKQRFKKIATVERLRRLETTEPSNDLKRRESASMDSPIEDPNCPPVPFIRKAAENRENKVSRRYERRLINK